MIFALKSFGLLLLFTYAAYGSYCMVEEVRKEPFDQQNDPPRWIGALLFFLFVPPVSLFYAAKRTAKKVNGKMYHNVWIYRWLENTIGYPKHIKVVDNMNAKGLRYFVQHYNPDTWAARKIMERAVDRLEDLQNKSNAVCD